MESSPKGHKQEQRTTAPSATLASGRTDKQPSFAAAAGPGAVENGSVTGNGQTGALLLVEEGVRDPGSIISGS